jgi:hypothetical protein
LGYPDAQSPRGEANIDLPTFRPGPNSSRRAPRAEGVRLPLIPRIPASLQSTWRLDTRQIGLATLMDALRRSGGPKVDVPPHARARKLWICSRGTRAEVLQAVADLWGWELAPSGSGYRLGRPRFDPPQNPADLHKKMGRAIPPALWHLLAARLERTFAWDGRQMECVLAGADRVAGENWRGFPVIRLGDADQNRLAHVMLREQLRLWYELHGQAGQIPGWLLQPERGYFTLSGPLGPGQHPTLMFHAGEQGGGAWGWGVGTSSTLR